MALLFISHDIALASQVADRIAVFRHGRLVEIGDAESLIASPRHPYTKMLLDAHMGLDTVEPWHNSGQPAPASPGAP